MIKITKPEKVGFSTEKLEHIGESMRSLIDAKKIPGTVTLVARRGEVVHFEANGMRDIEKGLAMETDTIHRIYSQSKPVLEHLNSHSINKQYKFLITPRVIRNYVGESRCCGRCCAIIKAKSTR